MNFVRLFLLAFLLTACELPLPNKKGEGEGGNTNKSDPPPVACSQEMLMESGDLEFFKMEFATAEGEIPETNVFHPAEESQVPGGMKTRIKFNSFVEHKYSSLSGHDEVVNKISQYRIPAELNFIMPKSVFLLNAIRQPLPEELNQIEDTKAFVQEMIISFGSGTRCYFSNPGRVFVEDGVTKQEYRVTKCEHIFTPICPDMQVGIAKGTIQFEIKGNGLFIPEGLSAEAFIDVWFL